MHAERSDRIRRFEFPPRIDRLHDFEAMRDRIDAFEQFGLVHAGLRNARETQADLRLDARLEQAARGKRSRSLAAAEDGRVVHRPPDRRVQSLVSPDGGIGEADLPADGFFAARCAPAL